MMLATCCRATEKWAVSGSASRVPSTAARSMEARVQASTSLRTTGTTKTSWDRRLARPTRCRSADTDPGGPSRTTIPTSPMSIPTSSVEVAIATASSDSAELPLRVLAPHLVERPVVGVDLDRDLAVGMLSVRLAVSESQRDLDGTKTRAFRPPSSLRSCEQSLKAGLSPPSSA